MCTFRCTCLFKSQFDSSSIKTNQVIFTILSLLIISLNFFSVILFPTPDEVFVQVLRNRKLFLDEKKNICDIENHTQTNNNFMVPSNFSSKSIHFLLGFDATLEIDRIFSISKMLKPKWIRDRFDEWICLFLHRKIAHFFRK